MIQDGAGPTGPSAQDVAIREPAADRQHLEICQGLSTAKQVGHMDIDRRKPCPVKRRSHLNLTINALLPQDRNARLRFFGGTTRRQGWPCEFEMRFQTWGIDFGNRFPFFSGAVGVVAQCGQAVGGLSPHGL